VTLEELDRLGHKELQGMTAQQVEQVRLVLKERLEKLALRDRAQQG